MSQLTRRIRQIEVQRIKRTSDKATVFIDDITIRGEAVEH